MIRRAHPDDAPFLAWVVLASARSHLARGFWDLFVPEGEAERLALAEQLVLAEEPSWWHWSLFWIAEHGGRAGAALSGFDPTRLVAPNAAMPAAVSAPAGTEPGTSAGVSRSSASGSSLTGSTV
jgi:hypothetical protein